MESERRVRLTEDDIMEGGLRCPECETYTTISDIVARGRCRNDGRCGARLRVDVVVEEPPR